MSRYFKYKSSEGLLADARALGLDIALSEDLSPLFRPIEIGGRRVGNRLAIQPMEGCDGELDGSPGELTFRRYRRFGAGGAKLIWGEASAVVPEGRANPRQLVIDPATAPALERLLRDDAAGPRRGGRDRRRPPGRTATDPFGPLLVPAADPGPARPAARSADDRRQGHRRRPPGRDTPLLTDDELDRLQDRYVEAAALAYPDRLRFRRHQAVPSLPAQRAAGRPIASRQVRRLAREPDAVHPRARGPNPVREPGRDRRDPPERLRRRPLPERARRTRGPLPVHAAGPLGLGHRPGRPVTARPGRAARPDRHGSGTWASALINVSIGNPYASPHLLRPFEYPPPDGYETPEHPLIGVRPALPAHRGDPGGLSGSRRGRLGL